MNFKHSESTKEILPAMIAAQSEMPQLKKDANNSHAKSKYFTLDNILGDLIPILNKNNILLKQIPVQKKEENTISVGVDTVFFHKSGEFLYYPAVFFEFEKGGRMNNTQSTGSLITYARRYELTSIFGISTNEDADGLQPDIDPVQAEKDRKWEEFSRNRKELFKRVEKLAAETMESTKTVNKALLERTSKELGDKQLEITPQNIATYNGQLRKAEANFKANQSKKERTGQQSILKGNTTEPVGGNANE